MHVRRYGEQHLRFCLQFSPIPEIIFLPKKIAVLYILSETLVLTTRMNRAKRLVKFIGVTVLNDLTNAKAPQAAWLGLSDTAT